MAPYHIWHPSYLNGEKLVIEAFITEGEAWYLNTGTDELFADVAEALGLGVSVTEWTMVPLRTHYFSSYRDDSDDWRERWKLAWWVRFGVDKAVPLPAEPSYGFFDLDSIDQTYVTTTEPRTWPEWQAAVIANARDFDHLERLQAAVSRHAPRCTTSVGQAFGCFLQLRCFLRSYPRQFFENGAAEAEALVTLLDDLGGATRFHLD